MSEIPTISITQTETDDLNEPNDLNINDVHTDVESIDSDAEINASSAKSRFLKSCPDAASKLVPTDIEDFNSSGSEDELIEQPEVEISFNDYLDQGYVEEAANISDRMKNCKIDGGKIKISNSSLCIDDSANKIVLTDCENMDASDDGERSEYVFSDVSVNLLPDQNNVMKINDSVKKLNKKMAVKEAYSTSSESEGELKPTKHNHGHRHHHHHHHHQKKSSIKFDHSDVENIIFSDDDDSAVIAKPKKNRKSKITFLEEPEEMIMLISDNEEASCSEKCRKLPEINITFGTDKKSLKKKSSQKSSGLSLALPVNTDDILTDVENLNSSDDDDDDNHFKTNLSIPSAVFKTGNLTDVEDFDEIDDDDDDDQLTVDESKIEVLLPSPTRQMIILSENDNVSKVLPLSNSSFLLVQPIDDSGLTDNEDLSDYEDDDLSAGKKYQIDRIPDYILESGMSVVNNNDKILNDDQSSSSINEMDRKKRLKSKSVHKHKKLLTVVKQQAVITTDVEELSDDDHCKSSRKSSIKLELELPVVNDDGGKTDVEYFSEDEAFINYYIPEIDNDCLTGNTYFSLIHLKDGENSKERENKNNFNLPVFRKHGTTPIQLTDSEALTDDDGALNFNCNDYRSDMVTPNDLCYALNESGCSTIHDVDTRVFDVNHEKDFIKGFKDINEVHTDVEVLVEDEQ